jgi:hypothetical protein
MAKTTRIKGEHGWDGPVEIRLPGEVNWRNDCKTLAALIRDSAPIGSGPNAGTLQRDLSLVRAGYKKLPPPRRGFELVVHNSYAKIQDEGGDIPERVPKGYLQTTPDQQYVEGGERAGKALKWTAPDGSVVFAKHAGPFHVEGSHYLRRGLDRWLAARGHGEGFAVAWKRPDEVTA